MSHKGTMLHGQNIGSTSVCLVSVSTPGPTRERLRS